MIARIARVDRLFTSKRDGTVTHYAALLVDQQQLTLALTAEEYRALDAASDARHPLVLSIGEEVGAP